MTRIKILSTLLFVTIFLATQVVAVGAAPARQEALPVTGTVINITLETDPATGVTTVLVTLQDETGAEQTVRLSLEEATALDLLQDDGTVDPGALDTTIESAPATVMPEAVQAPEEAKHPVGSALSDFFYDLTGVDYETVMEYHEEGVGFGVIAQALWMTNALEGDSETFAAILEAKQNHDYSGFTLPDGSTPTNWGQFRKAVMHDREKAKENLGAIMSGHAEGTPGTELQNGAPNNGNGNGNQPDKDKGKKKDKGNNGNGKEKDKNKGKNH